MWPFLTLVQSTFLNSCTVVVNNETIAKESLLIVNKEEKRITTVLVVKENQCNITEFKTTIK